ncbi:hypothetical protein [Longimicrobium sp.]|uniref:hypothetical protein n=1 Tax=Longimicrobium sp. TaxID=2029185 RepID=UPI002E31603E|nr:hypothetical protein [Longimicrobium sp.]HEX6040725.1 hypothetical protein [Longimicrobium sp.]
MKESPDPTLDHIRQVRHQISAEFNHDPHKLVEHYMRLQERHADRLVRPAQPVRSESAA